MNNPQSSKRCPRCETIKDLGDFYRIARGYSGYCKPCQQAYKRTLPGFRTGVTRQIQARQEKRWANGTQKRIKLTPIERIAREMWRNAHKRSVNLRREATVSYERINTLTQEFCSTHEYSLETNHPLRPSLDRIDNGRGYHDDNVRIVWFMHNMARNRFTDAQVLDFCYRFIAQYGPEVCE